MTNKPIVLFDEAHGQINWIQAGAEHTLEGIYSRLATVCEPDALIVPLQNSISEATISKASAIVIPAPAGHLTSSSDWEWKSECHYSNDECRILHNFIQDGGGLLLMAHRNADPFTKTNLNSVARYFGFEFEPYIILNSVNNHRNDQWLPVSTNIETHPITSGVNYLCHTFSCPIRVVDSRVCRSLAWPAQNSIFMDLSETIIEPNGEPFMVVAYPAGRGCVVGLGSDLMFDDVFGSQKAKYDNLALGRNLIRYLSRPELRKNMSDFIPKIFISHQYSDKPFARKLSKGLLEKGYDVWFDEFKLVVGDSLTDSISNAIAESDFFILIISKKALASKWVNKEYAAANARSLSISNFHILPVLIDDCDIPNFLQDVVWVDARENFIESFKRLVKSIESHLERQRSCNKHS